MSRLISILVLALLPMPASANWFRSRTTVAYYYYPMPVAVYQPVWPVATPAVITVEPPAVVPQRIYAQPVPAPASPPRIQPVPSATPPGVKESSSFYDAYAVVSEKRGSSGDRCSIGFWNTTGRNMTLRVQGQGHLLAAGKGLTLELPRRFTWQVDDRPVETVEVPARDSALDVVIRR